MPAYAVPGDDVTAELVPAGAAAADAAGTIGTRIPELSGRPVLDPSVSFAVHSAEGHAADLRAGGPRRSAAGFYPVDPDLAGYVVLDFGAFDAWYEEDELNVAHPRDPFHRIDVFPSSRHVRVELDGRGWRPHRSRYRLDIPAAAARRRAGSRPHRILQRAARRHCGRRTPRAAHHPLVFRAGHLKAPGQLPGLNTALPGQMHEQGHCQRPKFGPAPLSAAPPDRSGSPSVIRQRCTADRALQVGRCEPAG